MRNIDARGPDAPPLAHYLREGAARGYDPCGAFSTRWYRFRHKSAGAEARALVDYVWRGRVLWHSTHPTLPPPGSPVAEWSDLPWSPPFASRPEAARRVLLIVGDIGAWRSCGGHAIVAALSNQPDLDVFVLSFAPLDDLPDNVARIALSQRSEAPITVVSRVLRALKFRDAAAVVVQIGRHPEASALIQELDLRAAVSTPGEAPSVVPALLAKLPAQSARNEVSAIIPCYNHARYLDERIGSILRQRVQPAEIIALDDGSTDDSIAILERWQRISPVPFRIVRNEHNSGLPFGQWAKGVTLAQAGLVWIAESDDTSSPHFLERLLPYFADERLALGYAESRIIGAEGQWLADSYRFYTDSLSGRKWLAAYVEEGATEIDQALAVKNTIPNASAVVFRRAALMRHLTSVESFRYCGDWWAYVSCLRDGRIAYHPEALNSHRRSEGSVTDIGERGPVMLAEALRIKSAVWRFPGASDRGRVLGLVQLLVEAALRGGPELDGTFVADVVAAWPGAVGSNGRPIDSDAISAGFDLLDRLVREAVALDTDEQRESVLTCCRGVLSRLGISFSRP
ncbi:MAG: glycosyltransferase [Xanthobacteraceae bacterium]|nr:glycosyltransferase [Xanthobacteraceae bacterium]